MGRGGEVNGWEEGIEYWTSRRRAVEGEYEREREGKQRS